MNINTAPKWNKWQAGAAATGIGAGAILADRSLGRVDKRVEQVIDGVGDIPAAIAAAITAIPAAIPAIPTDLAAAIAGAEHSAHDITAGLAVPAQTGVTILVVLAGIVAAYEMYRFAG
eukprot:4020756-Prymnesium_polylepis.1